MSETPDRPHSVHQPRAGDACRICPHLPDTWDTERAQWWEVPEGEVRWFVSCTPCAEAASYDAAKITFDETVLYWAGRGPVIRQPLN